MNYLIKTLEKDTSSGRKANLNIKLLHPVLFVFIDGGEQYEAMVRVIESFFETKLHDTSGIAYLSWGAVTEGGEPQKTLDAIQNTFLRNTYERPAERRVYFVHHPENGHGELLKDAVLSVGSYFSSMNYTPILDVFGIIDEGRSFDEKCRRNIYDSYSVMREIAELPTVNMVFLLSTLSNKTTLNDISVLYQALPQCSLIKDFAVYKNGDFPVYNERKFIDNCLLVNGNGRFFTMGFKTVDKPNDIIKAIVLKELITHGRESDERYIAELTNRFAFLKTALLEELPGFLDELTDRYCGYIYSLPQDLSVQGNRYGYQGEALDAYFGKNEAYGNNVDAYYELNFKVYVNRDFETKKENLFNSILTVITECLESRNIGFYRTRSLLIELRGVMAGIKTELNKKCHENELLLAAWPGEPFYGQNTDTLGLFCKLRRAPYALAVSYFKIKSLAARDKELLSIYNECEKSITGILKEMDAIYGGFCESVKYLDSFIEDNKRSLPQVVTMNIENYYADKTRKWLNENADFFSTEAAAYIYKPGQRVSEDVYEKIAEIAELMLNCADFNENILTEIYRRISSDPKTPYDTDKKITDFLTKEVINDKAIFLNLLFTDNLFETTCVITADKTLINTFRDIMTNICFFYDSSDTGLNIVYFTGTFSPGQMLYAGRYGFINRDGDILYEKN